MTTVEPCSAPPASVCSRDRVDPDFDQSASDGGRDEAFDWMRMRIRLWGYISAALLALALMLASSAPARANLLDCVKAPAPIDDAAKAAELASKVGMCAAGASDAVEATVVVTIVALAAAGQIPADTDGCNAKIDEVVGRVVAQALIDAGLGNAFGEDALKDLAKGVGSVSNIPGLGALSDAAARLSALPEKRKKLPTITWERSRAALTSSRTSESRCCRGWRISVAFSPRFSATVATTKPTSAGRR